MWLYGEKVLTDVIKLRLFRYDPMLSKWALNTITSVLTGKKQSEIRQKQKRRKWWDHGGRDWSEADKPRNAGSLKKLEETRKGCSSDTQPCQHLDFSLENLISASGLQNCEIINVCRFFFATKFVVISYSIHRKLITYTINIKFKNYVDKD